MYFLSILGLEHFSLSRNLQVRGYKGIITNSTEVINGWAWNTHTHVPKIIVNLKVGGPIMNTIRIWRSQIL